MLSCRLARLSHVKSKTPDEIQFIHPANTYKFLKKTACRGKKTLMRSNMPCARRSYLSYVRSTVK
jgi:hypothetical protein